MEEIVGLVHLCHRTWVLAPQTVNALSGSQFCKGKSRSRIPKFPFIAEQYSLAGMARDMHRESSVQRLLIPDENGCPRILFYRRVRVTRPEQFAEVNGHDTS
jgi:hypothetical protein